MTSSRPSDRPGRTLLRGLWSAVFAILFALHAMPAAPQALPGERLVASASAATALPAAQLRQHAPPAQLSGHRLTQPQQHGNPHGGEPALASSAPQIPVPLPRGASGWTAPDHSKVSARPAAGYHARAPPLSA